MVDWHRLRDTAGFSILLAVGTELGYTSQASFSRAFKKQMGKAPSLSK